MIICIPSYGRANAIEGKTLSLFPGATVIVRRDQLSEYSRVAVNVVPQTGSGISNARNSALDMFVSDDDVLMLDDDVKEIGEFRQGKKVPWETGSLVERIGKLFDYARSISAVAFSCSPTSNPFYSKNSKPISTNLFLIGTFSGYLKGCQVRFDETLPLKEDYDFTIKAWLDCGVALRFNNVYCDAIHYTNKGGAVETRNDQTEQRAISILLARWPRYIRLNTRRRNEVLLRLPK